MDAAVGIVQAYLRLNGFFTVTEYPIVTHVHRTGKTLTDLDVLAVRFPGAGRWVPGDDAMLPTDPLLELDDKHLSMIIGEVKEGRSRFNPAVSRMDVVETVIRRFGCCPGDPESTARAVIENGFSDTAVATGMSCRIRWVVFSGTASETHHPFHVVPLRHVVEFLSHHINHHKDVFSQDSTEGRDAGRVSAAGEGRSAHRSLMECRFRMPMQTERTCCCSAHGENATHCEDPISCIPLIKSGCGEFEVFTEGDSLYEAMLVALSSAQKSIRLESYIFADDEIGRQFVDVLTAKASAGVTVQVLIDAAGSLFWASRRLERFLRDYGVQVKWFHCWSWRHPLRYDQRNHRKLLVVDDDQAFLGGFNIHRENSRTIYGEMRWRDTHLRIGTQLAVEAARQFDAVWSRRHKFMDARLGDVSAVVISNIFRNCRRRFRCLYWDRITSAGEKVYLTTPYFAPDWRTLRRLASASRRGIDVHLLLPRKSDVPIVRWAAHALYAGLLEAGVRIYEYLPRPLHAKTAVIDGEWSIVGSSNLDYRSFGVNYEINLVARDPGLTQLLTNQFLRDLEESEEIIAEIWANRPRLQRFYEWIGRMLQRWL